MAATAKATEKNNQGVCRLPPLKARNIFIAQNKQASEAKRKIDS